MSVRLREYKSHVKVILAPGQIKQATAELETEGSPTVILATVPQAKP